VAVLALVTMLAGGACEKRDQDAKKVIHAIDATSPLEHRFVYRVESRSAGKLRVQGIVVDDFRYKLQLSLNDTPAIEEIVDDDAVAVRFLDAGLVDGFTDRQVVDKVDQTTNVPGATVIDALKAKRWVLDDAGAPSAVVDLREEKDSNGTRQQSRDPLFEARTALAYVRRTAANNFVKYDPETLNPTYRRDEDPFPKPAKGSGVTRYDSQLVDLPPASSATSGSTPQLPSIANFRKMAVYVKGGRVIAVREFIGLSPRQLRDLTKYVEAIIDATAPDEVLSGFRKQVASLSSKPDELSDFLLDGLNTFVVSAGRDAIRFRTMSLELQDFGDVAGSIELPTQEAVLGDLAVLQNLGRKPLTGAEDEGARPAVPQPPAADDAEATTADSTADSTATTSTTVAP
jgi:hypothetical protein